MAGKNFIAYIPDDKPSKCGYCKGKTSLSSGMWAYYMTVQQYQDMIDHGWRRSGRYVYKPKNKLTCCPLYTIRCHVDRYQPSKSQKKVAKKVNNYLKRGKSSNNADNKDCDTTTTTGKDFNDSENVAKIGEKSAKSENLQSAESNGGAKDTEQLLSHKRDEASSSTSAEIRMLGQKKSKIRRLERRIEKKMSKQNITEESNTRKNNGEKGLSDYLDGANIGTDILNQVIHQTDGESYKHQLSFRLVRADQEDSGFKEHLEESYQVYKKYQMSVHGDAEDECSMTSYLGFLVDSPLSYEVQKIRDKEVLLGAFHQHYLIDGRIVGVGVIDILPDCVSSVYLYYDPQFSHLSLGTYSAIREIQLCASLGIEFYYMGYYIHSCDKMRYKGKYLPSDLCCPETYTWHTIEKCLPKLEANKYSTFTDQSGSEIKAKSVDYGRVKFFINQTLVRYSPGLVESLSSRTRASVEDYLARTQHLAQDMISVLRDTDSDSEGED